MKPTRPLACTLALLLSCASVPAQNFDHPHQVAFDGRWGTPAEAAAAGYVEHRGLWVAKTMAPKLRQWEREDAKVRSFRDAWTTKSKHYQIRTDLPHHLVELEIKPFLDVVYQHFTTTFRERFGIEGKGANYKRICIYNGYGSYRAVTGRPRTNPGYITNGSELHMFYEAADPGCFYQTMMHEGAHQFFAGLLPGATLPHWMNEALATYFEAFTYSRATRTIREMHVPPDRLWGAKQHLARLAKADPQEQFMQFGADRYNGLHYAVGWSYLHYLVHHDGGRLRARFGSLLKELNGTGVRPFAEVFERVYGEPLAPLTSGWKPYVMELAETDKWQWPIVSSTQPLAEGKLLPGDAVSRIDGVAVRNADALRSVLAACTQRGTPTELVLVRKKLRGGEAEDFDKIEVKAVFSPAELALLVVGMIESRQAGLAD